jgi:type I restriction enzyme S subunit
MKSARITDLITDKISGEWGDEPQNGNGVKVLRTTNFTNNGRLNLESVVVRDIEERLVTKKQLKFGDTIIEKSGGGPKQPVGRVVYFDVESEEPYLCNNFTAILRPKKVVDSKYFFYSLFAKHGLSTTLKYQNKTTGIINLQLERYLEEEIPIPSLPEQQKIAAILSQVDAAREKRKQANALTEQFLQSTFLTLFGDPVKNEKGWEVRTINDFIKKEKHALKRGPFGGALKKEIFVSSGYLVYEQFHALNNDFTFARYFIDEDKFQELKSFEVKEGDIIVSCSGVYLGKLAIIPKGAAKGIINQALLKISLDERKINSHFFVYLFSHPSFKSKFYGNISGTGIPNFPSMDQFKKFQFIYPPLSLQQKFTDIVNQTEQLRSKQRQSEQELEQLFQSLLQRYFG